MWRAVAKTAARPLHLRAVNECQGDSCMPAPKQLPIRGYLIHITHYDPVWYAKKATEKPFDLDVGREIVDALAAEGLNMLIIDCYDGVRYRSHPELAKHYSVPMSTLSSLVAAARKNGLEVVPKLNFSRSRHEHHHNDWILGPGEGPNDHFDDDFYWKKGFEVIDEVIAAAEPPRFFHVGMDEDTDRSCAQYVAAIKRLRSGLRKRKLRTIIWNGGLTDAPAWMVIAEKSLVAEKAIPRDIVQLHWRYDRCPTSDLRRIAKAGFELWGAPGGTPERARAFRDALLRLGGKGLVMTAWIPCIEENRKRLLDQIRALGPVYRGEV